MSDAFFDSHGGVDRIRIGDFDPSHLLSESSREQRRYERELAEHIRNGGSEFDDNAPRPPAPRSTGEVYINRTPEAEALGSDLSVAIGADYHGNQNGVVTRREMTRYAESFDGMAIPVDPADGLLQKHELELMLYGSTQY